MVSNSTQQVMEEYWGCSGGECIVGRVESRLRDLIVHKCKYE